MYQVPPEGEHAFFGMRGVLTPFGSSAIGFSEADDRLQICRNEPQAGHNCVFILSTAISTILCGAEAAAGANRRRNTGGSGGLPPTRPAACRRSDPPDHRQRVCGGGAGWGRWRCCLDSRRLSVRRKPNGAERLSKALSRRVSGCIVRRWSR